MNVTGKGLERVEGLESKRECFKRSMFFMKDQWRGFKEDLEAAQKNSVEELVEIRAKGRDLELLRQSVNERSKEIDLIQKSLDERLKRLKEEEDELSANHGRLMQEFDVGNENYCKEADYREEKLRELFNLVERIFEKIDLEKKEREGIKELFRGKILQMDFKEKNLQRENEFYLTWIMKRLNEKSATEIELKEGEDLKKVMKDSVNVLVGKRKKLLEERELEIELKEHALETWKEELALKQKEVDFFRELIEKLVKELESREKELDCREKQLESVKKYTQNCFKDYLSKKKECKLEKELLDKEFKDLEERKNKLEMRDKELDLIEKRYKYFLGACLKAGIIETVGDDEGNNGSYADLRIVTTMDGKQLQIYLNEHTNKLDTMAEEVFKALHLSLDPAKLVLDAMEGFYPPHLRKGDKEFEASVIRRSCFVMLQQLGKISPNIQPHVRDEAIKLAIEWKGKLMTADPLQIFGFLQLLASYNLVSAFDADEIMSLFESVAHYQQAPELCRSLGFANKAQGFVDTLLKNAHYIEAVSFIYAFELADHFPPVPILKNYLEHIEEMANGLLKMEIKSQKAQKEAVEQRVAAMRAVIRCITDYKLESEYSPKILEERIQQLLAWKKNKEITAPKPPHIPKKTQQKLKVNQILPEGASFPSKVVLSTAPNSSKTNICPHQPMIEILANMTGKELLFFLEKHVNELGLLCYYVSCALKLSNESVELVLDAIKGLYDSLHKEEREDEATSKWRSCILLLEQLMLLSLDIRAETKEEARKLAVDLRKRIQSGPKNPLAVFGFLLFIDTYGLTSSFHVDELLSFYGSDSHDILVASLCQALGISKQISESSLPQCLAEVLGCSLENLVVNNRIDSTSMVSCLDVKSFSNVMDAKGKEHTCVSGEVPAFICTASDPASLVLDALLRCYNSMHERCFSFKLVAKSFFQLLQQLMRVSPVIKLDIREKATKFSLHWKAKWPLHLTGRPSSWEALAFLQFVLTYKVRTSFGAYELHGLQDAAYQPKEAISLFRSLSLVDTVPKLISNLIKNKQLPLALIFVYEFELVDKFPPVPLLKNYLQYCKKLAKKRCDESHKTAETQEKAILMEISALTGAIRCIKKYQLETEFPTDELRNHLAKLQREKTSLTRAEQQQLAATAEVPSFPNAQPQEEGTKKRSAISARIIQETDQPVRSKCARLSQ